MWQPRRSSYPPNIHKIIIFAEGTEFFHKNIQNCISTNKRNKKNIHPPDKERAAKYPKTRPVESLHAE